MLYNAKIRELAKRWFGAKNCFRMVLLAVSFAIISLVPHQEKKWSLPEQARLKHDHILSASDKERYIELFAAERKGDAQAADEIMASLDNTLLVGHTLALRYQHPAYNSKGAELASWLERFGDLPEARAIHTIASRKTSGSVPRIDRAASLKGIGGESATDNGTPNLSNLRAPGRQAAKDLFERVTTMARAGNVTAARNTIELSKNRLGLTAKEYDLCLWRVASAYMAHGNNKEAMKLALAIAERGQVPEGYWIAGLAAWRMNDMASAADYFTRMGKSPALSSWQTAAAHFWTYRALSKEGNADANEYLEHAANYPRTFYGIIAASMLDRSLKVEAAAPLTGYQLYSLLESPGIQRAVALAEIDEKLLAEDELRRLFPTASDEQKENLVSLAAWLDLPTLQMRMGLELTSSDKRYDSALYPIPRLEPAQGFNIDPALVFAFARKESAFHASAKSHAGAMGLMQILPSTAHYISKRSNLAADGIAFTARDLSEPVTNITLGETYLSYLMDQPYVKGNLFLLAAAYNAGPGKALDWQKELPTHDPLLFVESIPYPETRAYVREVMTSYWIYSERMGNPVAISQLEKEWPVYNGYAPLAAARAQ